MRGAVVGPLGLVLVLFFVSVEGSSGREKGETGDLNETAVIEDFRQPPLVPRLRGDPADLDLIPAGSRNNRQSYSRRSPPKRTQYSHYDGHSDGRKGKGGNSGNHGYRGSSGYSTEESSESANKADYGDSQHKEFKHKDGDRYGGRSGGSGRTGGGRDGGSYSREFSDQSRYGREYSADGDAFYRSEEPQHFY